MLLAALALVVGFLLAPFVSPQIATEYRALIVPTPGRRILEFVVLWTLGAAYCTYGWSNGRRTLPQKTWKLALVGADGGPPSTTRAVARYLGCWIGPALAVTAYVALRSHGWGAHAAWLVLFNWLWAVVDRDRRFLHDRLAGTIIVATR